jgi:hypothetical protein
MLANLREHEQHKDRANFYMPKSLWLTLRTKALEQGVSASKLFTDTLQQVGCKGIVTMIITEKKGNARQDKPFNSYNKASNVPMISTIRSLG